ncbi:unnamed protein product [Durusdinium trenchii]|uniref:Uncharacterized protein n=1 Tax=Durusdinium trenchii TaxID=1381693 RepID=A0ABP0R2W8_9DINO
MSGEAADDVAKVLARLKSAGVELDSEAMQALETVPSEHVVEILTYVEENSNYLRNPSKYVMSTIARGYKPKSLGTGREATPSGSVSTVDAGAPNDPAANDPETMERLLLQAQKMLVVLSNEALAALADLSTEHAVEMLEFVLERSQDLRDVSKFIVGNVARGFKSFRLGVRRSGGDPEMKMYMQQLQDNGMPLEMVAQQALQRVPVSQAVEILEFVVDNLAQLKNPSSYVCSSVYRASLGAEAKGGGEWGWSPESCGLNPQHVPADITPLERRVLSVNFNTQGEQLDLVTYFALRCLPYWHATEMLDSLQARKGSISSPCNYIQAAVSKIQKGHGRGYGGEYSGHEDAKRQRMW